MAFDKNFVADRKISLILAIVVMVAGLVYYLSFSDSHTSMDHPPITSEDVFIAEMIQHHQEAVDTSRIMLNSDNFVVKNTATQIVDVQVTEIELLQSWKSSWYPNSEYVSKYESMMPELSPQSSQERDILYIKGMIKHHEGAIGMAKQLLELENVRPEVRQIATDIVNIQESEVEDLKQMLNSRGVLI